MNMLDNISSQKSLEAQPYTAKDLASDAEARWCPGCGDYSILNQVKKVIPQLGIRKEDLVFVSGIGCSSRFPYYMNAYGLHGIHGRALAIASGTKIARPELSLWVVTGDGDCMSIGGNHMIHALRRNLDINILMLNNEIYGLTKGQFSPTSHEGQITKSSPLGVLDNPFNTSSLALGAGTSFFARTLDRDPTHMRKVIEAAARHKGTSFVEIYQNCLIFNDGAFDGMTAKESRKEQTLYLEHGKPMIFGATDDKGIILDHFRPKVVSITDGKHLTDDLLVHDEKDSTLAFILANMTFNPQLPRPFGVFQSLESYTYEDKVEKQIEYEINKEGKGSLEDLLKGDDSWEIK